MTDDSEDFTIPSRKRSAETTPHFTEDQAQNEALPKVAPWVLQQYFDGEVDLNRELGARFPQIPVMSLINVREVGTKSPRGVAMLATQDGAASLVVEVDSPSRAVQFTFVHSSVLALRFFPGKLTQADRAQWLEPMRRETGEAAFLWDQSRWENDYLIGLAHKTFTNLFAFSPYHTEAAARLTPEVARKLLDWLGLYWQISKRP
jgi:hypothetical protein